MASFHRHSNCLLMKNILSFIAMTAVLGYIAEGAEPAATSSPTPQPSLPPACTSPEFRQFDFWLGGWKVKNAQGKQVGSSEISRVSEGCAIREQWTAAGGMTGSSLNYYDAGDREWHQHWVGGDGTILHLHGGLI